MRISPIRAVAVTLGLAGLGAVFGAVLGGITMLVTAARLGDPVGTWPADFLIGAIVGVEFGMVLAPIVGWVFLRRVSLGQAIAETSVGILTGVAVGAIVYPSWCIILGLLGFLVAGIRLWITTRGVARGVDAPATPR